MDDMNQMAMPSNAPSDMAAQDGLKVQNATPRIEPDPWPDAPQTPLHIAVRRDDPDGLKALLDAGANPNVRDDEDMTPLHVAAKRNRAQMVQMLLDAGADQRLQNRNNGWTPLHYVALKGRMESAIVLLSDKTRQN